MSKVKIGEPRVESIDGGVAVSSGRQIVHITFKEDGSVGITVKQGGSSVSRDVQSRLLSPQAEVGPSLNVQIAKMLAEGEPMSQSAIAKALGKNTGQVKARLAILAGRGLVMRIEHPSNPDWSLWTSPGRDGH